MAPKVKRECSKQSKRWEKKYGFNIEDDYYQFEELFKLDLDPSHGILSAVPPHLVLMAMIVRLIKKNGLKS